MNIMCRQISLVVKRVTIKRVKKRRTIVTLCFSKYFRCFAVDSIVFRRKSACVSVCLYFGLALFVLTQNAYANSPPRFDVISNPTVRIGETLEIVIRPVDPDGQVPGMFADPVPQGAEFVDNRDGSRTFRWFPRGDQLGETRLLFVAIDALDASLRYSQNVFVTVVPSSNNQVGQTPNLPVATGNAFQVAGNFSPEIRIASTSVTGTGGQSLNVPVIGSDRDGQPPSLVAHALPSGASFQHQGNGSYSFDWTPLPWQLGDFRVVIVAIDAQRNSLRSQIELLISVRNPDGAQSVQQDSPPAQFTQQPSANESVQVNTGNRAPYFEPLEHQTVAIGQSLDFVVAPRDPDGDVPGMFPDRLPFRSTFTDNFDGTRTFRWSPFPADEGIHWITFTAIDARDDSLRAQQSVRITVENRGGFNFPPVINGIHNPVIRAGDLLRQRVQPVDPDGDVPRLSVLNPPPGATFDDNGDGTRTLFWRTDRDDITEIGDTDNPHFVDFLAVDIRDPSLRDDHRLQISVVEPSSVLRSGERLRTLAEERGVLVGFAAMLQSFQLADADLYLEMAGQEFNMLTPENSQKWGWIQPERGRFRFEDADALADYAIEHGMVLHGHTLVWHAQLPGWVQFMNLDEAEVIMNEHIDAVVSRYRGKVRIWDVVNEALEEDGSFRESVWYQAMGDSYISRAFIRARQRDPDAELIYNEFDVSWFGAKADGMYNLLRRELANGTPIDGVGFQMHLWTDFDQYDEVRINFQRFADLGLDIYITEFDVAMTAPDQLEQQAEIYERVMLLCLEQPACKAIQSWGFTDRYSWRAANRPLMFTDRYIAKPSYAAWQRALQR